MVNFLYLNITIIILIFFSIVIYLFDCFLAYVTAVHFIILVLLLFAGVFDILCSFYPRFSSWTTAIGRSSVDFFSILLVISLVICVLTAICRIFEVIVWGHRLNTRVELWFTYTQMLFFIESNFLFSLTAAHPLWTWLLPID